MSGPQSAPSPSEATSGARSRSLGGGPKAESFLWREEWGGPPQGKKVSRQGCGDGPVPVQIRPEEDAVGETGKDLPERSPRLTSAPEPFVKAATTPAPSKP
jgi:hypothetical protein